MKTVVILGAGFTGLGMAHKLLRTTAPKTPIKVILVSPNSHFYWSIASPRGIVPGGFTDEQLFRPIAPAFDQYKADSFEFVLGRAAQLDTAANAVEVALNDGDRRSITYDQLIIATGSSMSSGLPLKSLGTHEATLAALHDLQEAVGRARSIVVAGGGLTGVEAAGEIASRYGGDVTITLIDSAPALLQAAGALPATSKAAEANLKKLGVRVLHNARVDTATPAAGGDGPTDVVLSTGETITADVYLPLYGVRLNNEFIPEDIKDSHGNLALDPTNLQVIGTKNVWGVGDIGNIEPKQLLYTGPQITHLTKVLDAALTGDAAKVGAYKPQDKTVVVAVMGKKHAVGQMGKMRVFGWVISYIKGRTIFTEKMADYLDGKKLI